MLNCFKYFLIQILRQKVSKLDKKDFELYHLFTHNFLCQNDKLFIKMFELYLVFLCQNVSILPLCTSNALKLYKKYYSIKIGPISFSHLLICIIIVYFVKYDRAFMMQFKIDITISMCRTSIFPVICQ